VGIDLNSKGGLYPNQYGLRKRISTDDAICQMHGSIVHELNYSRFCLAIGIDIKNAFNSIKWEDVLVALGAWGVPQHLL